MRALLDLFERHRAGAPVGIYSVCSAHPWVLRASLQHARSLGGHALIEATSNQVNQEGGYTGLRPAAFRDLVWGMADEIGVPRERVLLGGDHLGPNAWQSKPADEALSRAGIMIAEYVSAGFRKIHLDCSMACGGDPHTLSDELIAERTTRLCAIAEEAWQLAGGEPPVYVIGTEVPVPGGAQETLQELAVTEPEAALATLTAHRSAFSRQGLDAAWSRVIGLVVQPGVEFDHDGVIDYVPAKTRRLSASLDQPARGLNIGLDRAAGRLNTGLDRPARGHNTGLEQHSPLVFEAHSTDYQTAVSLAALVRDHFAILKVGPALTFAMREAIWALDQIEREWLGSEHSSRVRNTVLTAMRKDPTHWRKYYHATGRALDLQLEYSLSDRIRYYWPVAAVAQAMGRLEMNFDTGRPPMSLLRQYMPTAHEAVRSGEIPLRTQSLVIHHIRRTLTDYSRACDPDSGAAGEVDASDGGFKQ